MSRERKHGGLDEGEAKALGLAPEGVVDFSVNVNPYGPPASVARAIREAPIERYPDPAASRARRALGAAHGVGPERVAVGNGAAEILWTVVRARIRSNDTALVVEPTFSELRRALERCGARTLEWRARAATGFAIDLDAIAAEIRRIAPAIVHLGRPNSPTAVTVDFDRLRALAVAAPQSWFVLDESFATLSGCHDDLARPLGDNVVRVRSLTKDFAIPGIRVGYALAAAPIVELVERERPPWSVSAPAEAAAVAACGEGEFLAASRRAIARDRAILVAGLREIGLAPLPSETSFVLVEVGDAAALRDRLLARHGVLVRDCGSFGLGRHVRVAVRTESETLRLLAALRAERGADPLA